MTEEYENKQEDIEAAQNGDKEKMEYLIENNKRVISSILKRFQDRGYETQDLYQVGVMGFIKCIKRFDCSFDVRLSTYAVPYILGEIKRYIRDDGPMKVSRSLRTIAVKAMELRKEYFNRYGKEIKIEEMAEILETSKEELALALESCEPVHSIDEELYKENKEGFTLLDKMSNGVDEEAVITNQLCMKELIQGLKDQERQVILLRYYRGKTQTEIAHILGTTQVQISRIEKRALEHMKVKLAI